MVEPSQLKKARNIIASLKQAGKYHLSASNSSSKSPISTDPRPSTQSTDPEDIISRFGISNVGICKPCSDTQDEPELNSNEEKLNQATVSKHASCLQLQSNADKNVEVRNIINKLKIHKEQEQDEIIGNSINQDPIKNYSYRVKIDYSNSRNCGKNVSNSSKEIINSELNYVNRQNNKRLKTRQSTPFNKPLELTHFYNVVKSVSYENTSNLGEPKKLVSNINKFEKHITENKNLDCNDLYNINNDVDSNTNKVINQTFTRKSNKHSPLKQENPLKLNKRKHKISFDEFCDNIIIGKDHKLKKEVQTKNVLDSFSKSNVFLKSLTTGSVTPKKENYKHTNSVPVTNNEIKSANKDLEKNENMFKEFIERIKKKIKYKSIVNTESDNKTEYNGTELSEVLMENNNGNIPPIISIPQPHTETRISQASLVVKDSEPKKETIDSEPIKNILLKSFSIANITRAKESHKHENSVPVTNNEIKCASKDSENGGVRFHDFIERFKIKKKDANKNTESVHVYDHKMNCNATESSEVLNNNDTPIISIPQLHTETKMLERPSCMINVCYLDENETYDLSSRTNLSDHNQKTDSQKHKIMYDFNQGTEIYDEIEDEIEDADETNMLNSITEQKDMNVSLENEMENNSAEFYSCICIDENTNNFGQNTADLENSLESRSHLLDNGLETHQESMKNNESSNRNIEANASKALDTFFKNIITNFEKKQAESNTSVQKNFYIKRYKKGKTKIYKLKKLKKKHLSEVRTGNNDDNLNFHDILKKITDNSETKTLSKFSSETISTSSSYITDDTESDSLSTGSKDLTSPQRRLRNGFNKISKDKSYCYSGKEWEDVSECDKEHVKMKIQDIFFQILEDFKKKKTSYFRHKRQSFDNCVFKNGRLQLKSDAESSMTVISSKAQRSKAKFQLIVYIMKKIQTLLETDTKITKRELYYQLKELINDQRVTDRAINAISCLLDVGMWTLNIIAQKGLVFGQLKLMLSSGEMLNCNIPGTLIPLDINDIVEIHSSAYFILVVEKESIFHKLIEEDLPNKLTRSFIMITGKGFPDLNTQLFLRKLWMVMSIPVFILVDADPHGINIMLNYRFGSVNNAHVSQHLAVPNAKWLGVYPSEMINLNITRQPLSENEIKLANSILRRPYMEFSPKLVDELNFLLTRKFKAGIEGLIKTDNYLSQVYLPHKFFTCNFI